MISNSRVPRAAGSLQNDLDCLHARTAHLLLPDGTVHSGVLAEPGWFPRMAFLALRLAPLALGSSHGPGLTAGMCRSSVLALHRTPQVRKWPADSQ